MGSDLGDDGELDWSIDCGMGHDTEGRQRARVTRSGTREREDSRRDISRMRTTPPATFASASRGFAWSFAASIAVIAVSFLAQVVLGRLLTQDDFGVYAIAIAFSDMISVFRDGGVSRWLGRQSPDSFKTRLPQAYLLTFLSAVVVGLGMAAAAFVVGRVYQSPQVTPVMLIIAISFPFGAYAVVGHARLQVEHRFQALAWIKVVAGFARYLLAIFLALRGFGPFSIAWSVVAASCMELSLYRYITGLRVLPSPSAWQEMGGVFRESRWSLSGAFSSALFRQVDYAVLGLLVPTNVLGAYYFAFQLVMQPVLLFNDSMRKVIVPVFAHLQGDDERETRGLRYGGVFVGLIATPLLLALGVTASPLNELLWRGNWQIAVPAIQALSVAMPVHLISLFSESIAIAYGEFRLWTKVVASRGVLTAASAVAAAIVAGYDQPTTIAVVMSCSVALSAILGTWIILRALRLPSVPLWTAFVPPYVLCLLVAGGVLWGGLWPRMGSALPTLAAAAGIFLVVAWGSGWLVCRSQFAILRQMIVRFVAR